MHQNGQFRARSFFSGAARALEANTTQHAARTRVRHRDQSNLPRNLPSLWVADFLTVAPIAAGGQHRRLPPPPATVLPPPPPPELRIQPPPPQVGTKNHPSRFLFCLNSAIFLLLLCSTPFSLEANSPKAAGFPHFAVHRQRLGLVLRLGETNVDHL